MQTEEEEEEEEILFAKQIKHSPTGLDMAIYISTLFLLGLYCQKSLRLRRVTSDRDEIWCACSSVKYALTDGVGFSICRHSSGLRDGGHDVISRRSAAS